MDQNSKFIGQFLKLNLKIKKPNNLRKRGIDFERNRERERERNTY